jgi:hypothetical protein
MAISIWRRRTNCFVNIANTLNPRFPRQTIRASTTRRPYDTKRLPQSSVNQLHTGRYGALFLLPRAASWECRREIAGEGYTACNDRTIHLVRGRGDNVMLVNRNQSQLGPTDRQLRNGPGQRTISARSAYQLRRQSVPALAHANRGLPPVGCLQASTTNTLQASGSRDRHGAEHAPYSGGGHRNAHAD